MAQAAQPKDVIVYATQDGKEPFTDWLKKLKDAQTRRRILKRIARVEQGNYGDFKSLKEGVFELRLHFGSGYRVYFAEHGDQVVVLLCGGDKPTQDDDIEHAKRYWKDFLTHA